MGLISISEFKEKYGDNPVKCIACNRIFINEEAVLKHYTEEHSIKKRNPNINYGFIFTKTQKEKSNKKYIAKKTKKTNISKKDQRIKRELKRLKRPNVLKLSKRY